MMRSFSHKFFDFWSAGASESATPLTPSFWSAAASPAPYTHFFPLDSCVLLLYLIGMLDTITVCGRDFTPELLTHLQQLAQQQPPPSGNRMAREACGVLAWFSPDGRPALSSAKVALRKLHKRRLLSLPACKSPPRDRPHRLRASGQPLPRLEAVPGRVEQVRHLHLYLISGDQDPWHGVWNDLIIGQHPCGDAPLVGAQLRYLVGSDHGWLGALGFGPAAFALNCRDVWIGWSTAARLGHLPEVVGLSRVLIRQGVRCSNLFSRVLSLARDRVAEDWYWRYGIKPLLMETYVDRARYTGLSLAASNWLRVGCSTGRGRLGQKGSQSIKDVWLYPLDPKARFKLQAQTARPLTPCPLDQSLAQADWCARELQTLDLGDHRRNERARAILQARWEQPQASFLGSFSHWTPAKGAYGLIEHASADISLSSLLAPHVEQTQRRMAAEAVVLLPEDTTTLNYTGLHQTTGLGPLGEHKGQGLWLHSLLAFRPDGIPLGVLEAQSWARPQGKSDVDQRNAQALAEKESLRWVESFQKAAQAGRRMPQTQLVVMTDREGDLYELHDAVQQAPANLHVLIRARHDRLLTNEQKLWAFMGSQAVGLRRSVHLPRGHGQPARQAQVQVRWAQVTIQAPAVGCKKSWPPLSLWAVYVHEPNGPAGAEPLDWMLLTDLPLKEAQAAWEKVQWYCKRWGIEEWHRALKSGCGVEHREFKTAGHLQRALAFDLIVAWRVLALVKLGRHLPQLPAGVLYSQEELKVLLAANSKKNACHQPPDPAIERWRSQPLGGASGRFCRPQSRWPTGRRKHGYRSAEIIGFNLGLETV
jgi:hypothetical protein